MIKKNILCFAAPLLLALSFFVSGCASSPSKKETAVLSSIDSHATKPHAAFISNGSFYIQFVFEGKDVYFKAEDSTQNADAMAKYNIALLKAVNPSKDVLENKGPNAVFISKGFESIIKTVLEDFLPKKNGEGKIVNVQDYEMFLYRDKDGNPALTSLEKAPKDIKIVGSVPDADFDALLLKTIQKDLAVKDKGATQFLFPLIG
ncbi:MAG: hypothetical protein LBM71_01175, partial [Elusimicrobiota bacterium]|nr:hypothetical protein [Elusimicrobiota bacterium]